MHITCRHAFIMFNNTSALRGFTDIMFLFVAAVNYGLLSDNNMLVFLCYLPNQPIIALAPKCVHFIL